MYKKRFSRCRASSFSPLIHSSKGQVTIFIIIGILLLLILGIIIAVKEEIVTFKPEELIPTEKGKVENYITACVSQLGQEALTKIGLQGGYVEVPGRIANDPSLHLKNSPVHVIPYWAIGQELDIPSLPAIEEDINLYLEKNIRDCVFSNEPFQETYDVREKSGIEATTEITDRTVLFTVTWNIEVRDKAGEKITELITHTAESDIKLKRTYETARRIVERELTDLKLEDLTQDLLALEHPDVPLSGFELSCRRKEWDVSDARSAVQDLLRINLKQLQVTGTEVVEFPEEFPYYQNHYVWNLGDDFSVPDVSVVFNFDNNYPFTFHVTPAQGGKMYSGMLDSQDSDLLSSLCVQSWKFAYDVVYPVVVRVRDETTGYNFQTAFTVHLIQNIARRQAEITPRLTAPTNLVSDQEYCGSQRIPMTVLTWELVDDGKGVFSKEPLEEVAVTFTCLRHQCDLGQTTFDFAARGYEAGATFNFPYCVGGILRGKKEQYKEDWERVVTKNGDTAELFLIPLFSVPAQKIRVVKHEFSATGALGPGSELQGSELASVKLQYDKNDTETLLTGQPFHVSQAVIAPQIDPDVQQRQQLQFLAEADFTYPLDIQVFDGNNLVGGYKSNWTVPFDQLESAQEIVFHIFSKAGASLEEQYALLSNLEVNSRLVPPPEIK